MHEVDAVQGVRSALSLLELRAALVTMDGQGETATPWGPCTMTPSFSQGAAVPNLSRNGTPW